MRLLLAAVFAAGMMMFTRENHLSTPMALALFMLAVLIVVLWPSRNNRKPPGRVSERTRCSACGGSGGEWHHFDDGVGGVRSVRALCGVCGGSGYDQ
jgi:hypothetical protein